MSHSAQSAEKHCAPTAETAEAAKDDSQPSAEGGTALPPLEHPTMDLLQVAASKIRKLQRTDDEDERIDLNCLEMAGAHMDYAPTYLKRLLRHVDMTTSTQVEVFHLLLYAAALEQGFVSQELLAEHADAFAPVPITGVYHAKNVLFGAQHKPLFVCDELSKTMRIMLGCTYDLCEELRNLLELQLSCILTGELALITLTSVKGKVPGFSACLNVGRYVTSDPARCYGSLLERINHLDEFSFKVRDELFVPMRNQQFQAHELNIFPGFSGLPVELYDLIIQHVYPRDFNSLARSCKLLSEVTVNSMHYKRTKLKFGHIRLRPFPTLDDYIALNPHNAGAPLRPRNSIFNMYYLLGLRGIH